MLSLVRFFVWCSAGSESVWRADLFAKLSISPQTAAGVNRVRGEGEEKAGNCSGPSSLFAAWRIFVPLHSKLCTFPFVSVCRYLRHRFPWIMKGDSLSGLLQLHWTDKLSRKSRNFHSLFPSAQSRPEAEGEAAHQSLCCPGPRVCAHYNGAGYEDICSPPQHPSLVTGEA